MRRLLHVLTLAACACACACAPAPCETCPAQPTEVEVSVCVDSAFTPAEADAAERACDIWTSALCGLVTLQPLAVDGAAPPGWCDVIVLQPRGDLAAAFESHHPGAVSTLAPRVAFVMAGVTDARIYAHEIGHALGVSHGDGLMAWRNPSSCVTRRAAVLAAIKTARKDRR